MEIDSNPSQFKSEGDINLSSSRAVWVEALNLQNDLLVGVCVVGILSTAQIPSPAIRTRAFDNRILLIGNLYCGGGALQLHGVGGFAKDAQLRQCALASE